MERCQKRRCMSAFRTVSNANVFDRSKLRLHACILFVNQRKHTSDRSKLQLSYKWFVFWSLLFGSGTSFGARKNARPVRKVIFFAVLPSVKSKSTFEINKTWHGHGSCPCSCKHDLNQGSAGIRFCASQSTFEDAGTLADGNLYSGGDSLITV